jgi:hypothetical protein
VSKVVNHWQYFCGKLKQIDMCSKKTLFSEKVRQLREEKKLYQKQLAKHISLFIFQADFNNELIYFDKEADGWNYDDFLDTIIGNYKCIKGINSYPSNFTS